jgi:tRNA threonylcarbamoyladenosine biosynthesis protein TsaB
MPCGIGMDHPISIAIETSGAAGGVALGAGDTLLRSLGFPANSRHAAQLICRLDDLLTAEGLRPADLEEVYVSSGPGSFTGLRIGVTVARTLAQAAGSVRCVAVPTSAAVAENARERQWQNLAVVVEARGELVYASFFRRGEDGPVPHGEPRVAALADVLAEAPRPLLLLAAHLNERDVAAEGVSLADTALAVPTAEGVWRFGRRLARAGRFTAPRRLLPLYARRPEAVRLWEQRHGRRREP